MRTSLRLALVALPLLAGAPAVAQTAAEELSAAGAAYGEGRLLEAARRAEAALADLREEIAAALVPTLPPGPEGWRALPARTPGVGIGGAGLAVARDYVADDAGLTASVVADSVAAEAVAALVAEPEAPVAPAGLERVDLGGRPGLLEWADGAGAGRLVVPLGTAVVAEVSGRGLDSPEPMLALMRAWDLEAVDAALR